MPSVSAIVLAKDSERTIEACIKVLLPAVDHVIVVDTGSTDDTVQVSQNAGAKVYHYQWHDDFAAARNFGDSLATSDWVIHVDSDEILRAEDVDKVRKMCVQYRKTTMPIVIAVQQLNIMAQSTEVDAVSRMFKRGTMVWRGIIHEQLYHRRGDKFGIIASNVGVVHDGYNHNAVDTMEKVRRNINLLQKGIDLTPDNGAYHYFLGRDSSVVGNYDLAIKHLRVSLDLMEQQNMLAHLEYAHKLLIRCLEQVNDFAGATEIANLMCQKFDGYSEGWYKPLSSN